MSETTNDTEVTIRAVVEVTLPVSAVWPDGVPDCWNTAEVLAVVRESGGLGAWVSEWCLIDSTEVEVTAPGQPTATGRFW